MDTPHDFMTLLEARQRLDLFFQAQPTLDVLMLSGVKLASDAALVATLAAKY